MEGTRQRFSVTGGIIYRDLWDAIRSHPAWIKVLMMKGVLHPEQTGIGSIALIDRVTGVEYVCCDDRGFGDAVTSAAWGLIVSVSWSGCCQGWAIGVGARKGERVVEGS